MRARALAGVLLLPIAASMACGGGGTSEPTPIPSLVGEYTGSWTQDLSMDGQPVVSISCPCTFTVPSQSGGVFFGRSTLSAPCDQGLPIAGTGRAILSISNGTIQASGAVSFRFSEDPPVGLSAGGCTITTMDAFAGSLSGSTLSAARNEAYDCRAADGHRYGLTVRLVASRG